MFGWGFLTHSLHIIRFKQALAVRGDVAEREGRLEREREREPAQIFLTMNIVHWQALCGCLSDMLCFVDSLDKCRQELCPAPLVWAMFLLSSGPRCSQQPKEIHFSFLSSCEATTNTFCCLCPFPIVSVFWRFRCCCGTFLERRQYEEYFRRIVNLACPNHKLQLMKNSIDTKWNLYCNHWLGVSSTSFRGSQRSTKTKRKRMRRWEGHGKKRV